MPTQIKERPVIFNAPMVRAILEGRKTQTRRVMKPQPEHLQYHTHRGKVIYEGEHRMWCWSECVVDNIWDFGPNYADNREMATHCPYGKPGDRLWVRESHWRFTGCSYRGEPWQGFNAAPSGDAFQARCYDDSQILEAAQNACAVVRVPSIHMPRWASRITLEITNVRVERLQNISDADARAEGADISGFSTHFTFPHRAAFHMLWDSINGQGAWNKNEWVWALTFRRLE